MSTLKSSAEDLTLNADGSNNDVIIQSDGSTLVTVDGSASGVGIGTTTPSAALEVKNTTDGSTFAFQATNDNDHEIVQIGAQADGDGYLTVHGQGASTNIKVKLDSDGTSSIDGGDLSIGNGNLVIGTAGKGIDFSATADGTTMSSELLDDYEEGSWNASYSGSAGSEGAMTIGGWGAKYTKIGRLVTVQGGITLTNNGSWTGEVRLTGLPFTPDFTTAHGGTCELAHVNYAGSSVGNVGIYITASQTYFRPRYTHDNDSAVMVQCSEVADAGIFEFMFSYTTAS